MSERVEISREMDQLKTANSQLRREIDRFESQVSASSCYQYFAERDNVSFDIMIESESALDGWTETYNEFPISIASNFLVHYMR